MATLATLLWPRAAPLTMALPGWQPAEMFTQSLTFGIEPQTWPLGFGLCMLNLAVLLTTDKGPTGTGAWAEIGSLAITGFGLLAVVAANPLTLLLIWTAFDLLELGTMVLANTDADTGGRAVRAFSWRLLASGLLLWAGIASSAPGTETVFGSLSPGANLLLVLAAAVRLGTAARLGSLSSRATIPSGPRVSLDLTAITAAAAVLPRVALNPTSGLLPAALMVSLSIAALAAAWRWLRSGGGASARAHWILACGSLAAFAALRGAPNAASAWTTALILGGGVLLLNTKRSATLNRALLLGTWSISALPFSLTAATWAGVSGIALVLLPAAAVAQGLLMAGYVLHTPRGAGEEVLDERPAWIRRAYPMGLGGLVIAGMVAGVWGWEGAGVVGGWQVAAGIAALSVALVTFHKPLMRWSPATAGVSGRYALYAGRVAAFVQPSFSWLQRVSGAVAATLEGEGAVMWTLLFLVLLVSLLAGAAP